LGHTTRGPVEGRWLLGVGTCTNKPPATTPKKAHRFTEKQPKELALAALSVRPLRASPMHHELHVLVLSCGCMHRRSTQQRRAYLRSTPTLA
jgi:hypothetical protein